jgi:hypothetical protein
MEEAISKFMEGMPGMERQESSGFQNINKLIPYYRIHSLPVPEQKANHCMTHADAV